MDLWIIERKEKRTKSRAAHICARSGTDYCCQPFNVDGGIKVIFVIVGRAALS